ncbi:uncharacterized protein LOC131023853 [Salvia miltiorrhiza]|uniref:uncharacterized protein LOC131023536 n=1 Tax=Salvia miltiorrhiza TaxID=226208 RepID=UPI0025AD08ED|nr:uncharacterized protein LOC131023536 [Salvia miltiorrhiza]XP_057809452.1 uncharacterized protein LOC131023853 [Salvia miltiorrhiza]
MAIEVFPDSPSAAGISPRISFSHDLSQSDVVPIEQYIRSGASSSSIDFDFCVFRESFDQESSSADELFFDGKILPIQIKKRLAPPPLPPSPLPPPPPPPPKSAESEEKHKSFWRFKRSSSLNCGSGYGRTLCPLPLLSRSNSTGSTASGKRSSISTSQKQNLLKSNSSQKPQAQSGYSSKPPLKKSGQFSHAGGIKFSPVLNVPPANLFGLGSIFSGGGKERSRKKY